jgi:hypothetical protein
MQFFLSNSCYWNPSSGDRHIGKALKGLGQEIPLTCVPRTGIKTVNQTDQAVRHRVSQCLRGDHFGTVGTAVQPLMPRRSKLLDLPAFYKVDQANHQAD